MSTSLYTIDADKTKAKTASQSSTMQILTWVGGLINTFICFYAIYLSFKCNKGFNFGSMLAAICCSPCYVVYRLAMGVSGCVSPSAFYR